MRQLANVAESGEVTWVAGNAEAFAAYLAAVKAGTKQGIGRYAFNLLRQRLKRRFALQGPIHHWRYPISLYGGEATAAESLYLTRGTWHLELHLATGFEGNPFLAMAFGAEPEIQAMFNFWNSYVPCCEVLHLLP